MKLGGGSVSNHQGVVDVKSTSPLTVTLNVPPTQSGIASKRSILKALNT